MGFRAPSVRVAGLAWVLTALALACGGGSGPQPPPPAGRSVVLLVVDGLRWDALWGVAAADGPEGSEALAEVFGPALSRSVYFSAARTVFPSLTFPANATLATGAWPREHGIPANRYLDRAAGSLRALDTGSAFLDVYGGGAADALLRRPKLYDLLPGPAVVAFHMYGTGTAWVSPSVADALYYLGDPGHYDYLATTRLLARLRARAAQGAGPPSVITLYWPGLDAATHRQGVGVQPEYLRSALDRNLRVLLDGPGGVGGLRSLWPGLEGLAFVLVSDHGLTEVRRWIPVGELRGALAATLAQLPEYRGLEPEEVGSCLRVEPAGGVAQVYVRWPDRPWGDRLAESAAGLATLEALGRAVRDKPGLGPKLDWVLAQGGGGRWQACRLPGEACEEAEVALGIADPDGTAYPGAAATLAGLGPEGGDLVLTPDYRGGWAFLGEGSPAAAPDRAVHGSLAASDVRVPLVVAAAGLGAGVFGGELGAERVAALVAELAGGTLPGQEAPDLRWADCDLVVQVRGGAGVELVDPEGRRAGEMIRDLPGARYAEEAGPGGGAVRIGVERAAPGPYRVRVAPAGEHGELPTARVKGRSLVPRPVEPGVFEVTVADLAPEVRSRPPPWAVAGAPYRHRLAAWDPEGEAVTWAALSLPSGMALDPQRGELTWTPGLEQLGVHTVEVAASDPRYNRQHCRWKLTVVLPAVAGVGAVVEPGGVRLGWSGVEGAAGYAVQRVHREQVEAFDATVGHPFFLDATLPEADAVGYLVYAIDPRGVWGAGGELVRVPLR